MSFALPLAPLVAVQDLARMTLVFSSCKRMCAAVAELAQAGFVVKQTKNKYRNPTPMGYRDLNLLVAVTLSDGTAYLCEVWIPVSLTCPNMMR